MVAGVLSSFAVNAAGPEFNKFPIAFTETPGHDLPLLNARNISTDNTWSNGNRTLQANPGDIIEFQVYYHNGAADDPANTAFNTVIKAFSSPALSAPSAEHWVSSTIEADNTSSVGSAEHGGDIRINIRDDAQVAMSLVPGSVTHYANWGSRDPRNGSPDISSVSQLPDSIFTSGVNVGDVRGCWQYSGYVYFQVRMGEVTARPAEPTGDFTVQKQVSNISTGIHNQEEVTALPGHTVEFRITISTTVAMEMRVSDVMDNRLQRVGNVIRYGTTGPFGTTLNASAFFFSGGLSLGVVNPGTPITIVYQATVGSNTANQVLVNTAFAASPTQLKSDTAQVRVGTPDAAPQPQCPLTWDSPTDSGRGVRRVGQSSNVRIRVTGLPANSAFTLVNQHTINTSVSFRSTLSVNASGVFDVHDATIIPSGYIAGDYNTFIEYGSGQRINCAGLRIVAVSTTPPPTPPQPPAPQRGLDIDKRVLNVSRGENFYSNSTTATDGETVRFQVIVRTTGDTGQTGLTVRDTLPSRLTFLSGDNIIGSGINIGSLAQNQSRTFIFEARVTGASSGSATNTAFVRSSEVGELSDDAAVNINATGGGGSTINRGLDIDKRVLNVSRGEDFYSNSTTASDGEIVRFQVIIRTTGNASQTGITVRDNLPSRLAFLNGDNLPGNSLNIGALSEGQSRTFTFEARVNGTSSATVTNTAYVRSSEVSEISDNATVFINQTSGGGSVSRDLFISKRVQNVTSGTGYSTSVSANPGDRVRYEIRIETLGTASQSDVVVRDNLPGRLSFTNGDYILDGRNLGSLSAGTVRTFTYEAIVANADQFSNGGTTLTNTATVRSDQVGTRSASAQVIVTRSGTTAPQLRKTAFNVTKNANATTVSANPGDIIVYTLYVRNPGSASLNSFVIEDNISDILELAEISDQGGALSVDSLIRWTAVTVPAGSEVNRSFRVRVREENLFPTGSDRIMVNVYGNEVRVNVAGRILGATTPVRPTTPRTGPTEWFVFALASASTAGYWLYRRKKIATV